MAFDTETRNRLNRMVTAARQLLAAEFTTQLQEIHGIQPDGSVTGLERLGHLSDEEKTASRALRDRIIHLTAGHEAEKDAHVTAVDRMVREQAFTVLNRFVATHVNCNSLSPSGRQRWLGWLFTRNSDFESASPLCAESCIALA